MKRCPNCNLTYCDENLFCLSDGTPLVLDTDDVPTAIIPSPFVQQPGQPVRQGVSPMFAYLAIGLFALLVGGAFVLWLKSDSGASLTVKNDVPNSNSTEPKTNKEQDLFKQQKANLQDEQALLEKERQRVADERRTLQAQKSKSVETTFNSVAEPLERITFRKGSVEETISGSVVTERSFVLRARSGQNLSASVGSNNGCVVFNNGSTSTSYTTSIGDNRLSLVNNCAGHANFNLTVNVR